jgi:hypothetical protein
MFCFLLECIRNSIIASRKCFRVEVTQKLVWNICDDLLQMYLLVDEKAGIQKTVPSALWETYVYYQQQLPFNLIKMESLE